MHRRKASNKVEEDGDADYSPTSRRRRASARRSARNAGRPGGGGAQASPSRASGSFGPNARNEVSTVPSTPTRQSHALASRDPHILTLTFPSVKQVLVAQQRAKEAADNLNAGSPAYSAGEIGEAAVAGPVNASPVEASAVAGNGYSHSGGVNASTGGSFSTTQFRTSYGSVSDSGIDVSTPRVAPLPTANMAPVSGADAVSDSLKDAIQDLFDIQTMVHGYQYETQAPLVEKMVDLTTSLSRVNVLTNPSHPQSVAHTLSSIPPELVDYVDEGRNPDIYTREIVELVQRGNTVVNGKMHAFKAFSERFAAKLRDWDAESRSTDGTKTDAGIGMDMDKEVGQIMRTAGLEVDGDVEVKTEQERNGDGGNAVKREAD